jgi:Fe-S-cluster formation regulator IscX/YfhJ
LLTKAVNATAGDDGWTTLGAIGNHLARSHPSWDPRTFGHTKLGSLVTDQPYLETRPSGNHLEVALKKQARKATAKKASTRRPAKKAAKKA